MLVQIAQTFGVQKQRKYALFRCAGFDFSCILWYNKTIGKGRKPDTERGMYYEIDYHLL